MERLLEVGEIEKSLAEEEMLETLLETIEMYYKLEDEGGKGET